MGIFQTIGGVLGLGDAITKTITGISSDIRDTRIAALEAETDEKRIALEERTKELEAQRDVLVAEQANRGTRWVRPALMGLIWIVLAKLMVWDKVVAAFVACSGPGASARAWCWSFRTDALDQNMWWVIIAGVGAYFLTRPFDKRRT